MMDNLNNSSGIDPAFLEFCQALANKNRQRILFEIFTDKSEHKVGEIAEKSGLAISTVSEHLTQMKKAGILTSRRADNVVFYKVNKEGISQFLHHIETWLTCC